MKHGHAKRGQHSNTYSRWESMKRRCTNPHEKSWPDYGGRGIKICDRWLNSYQAFLDDMGECPPGLSIERRDNAKDYEPGNCYWATNRQQSSNRRSNVFLEFAGKRMTLMEWANEKGMSFDALRARVVRLKWPLERALTEPVVMGRRRKEPKC